MIRYLFGQRETPREVHDDTEDMTQLVTTWWENRRISFDQMCKINIIIRNGKKRTIFGRVKA